MSLLINEAYASATTPLWTDASVWALPATIPTFSTQGGTPTAIASVSFGDKKYQYAEGYGLLYVQTGVWSSGPTITIYVSPSGSALDTKSVSYILYPNTAPLNQQLAGYWYDLSQIKYYDPAGFSSLKLMFLASTSNSGNVLLSVRSTANISNVATTDGVVTKLTTATAGAAGFKLLADL